LLAHTHDSLPQYTPSNLNCTSCHIGDGTRANAAPLAGAFGRYPAFVSRYGDVASIEDRVNFCFTRSLSGERLPVDSREMRDIVSYLAFLSRGDRVGQPRAAGDGMPAMPGLSGDSARGGALFASRCARCHGVDGAGVIGPALWGPHSFSIGASMARIERAASFIRHNMPYDSAGTLTDQQAYDIAAYVTSHPRPDLPMKERDWPAGDAPADVPYATAGHPAYHPPALLPRRNPAAAVVLPPAAPSHATGSSQ
jgi:thiosulfate dehydrogenase